MASDNRASRALATASGMSRLDFIQKMNEKAFSLGLRDTKVFDVTGLDERNVSTAADIAGFIRAAAKYPLIGKITSRYTYRCRLQNKDRYKNFINTNRLVRSGWKTMIGKTGYITASGHCVASILSDHKGNEITIVVLGSPTNSVRFNVARKLAAYGFQKQGRSGNGPDKVAGG